MMVTAMEWWVHLRKHAPPGWKKVRRFILNHRAPTLNFPLMIILGCLHPCSSSRMRRGVLGTVIFIANAQLDCEWMTTVHIGWDVERMGLVGREK